MSNITWFLCKATYTTTNEDGKQKKVSEELLFDAVSPTEAEARLHEEIGENDNLEVTSVVKTKIVKVLDDFTSKYWYKVKNETYLDEKKVIELILIRANSLQDVLNAFYTEYTSHDEATDVNKTKILTVYYTKD